MRKYGATVLRRPNVSWIPYTRRKTVTLLFAESSPRHKLLRSVGHYFHTRH